jgi:hypothetical protein
MFYDNTNKAFSLYNEEADVTLQIGEENWTRVRNRTGALITNGTVVRINGAQGDSPTIEKALSLPKSGSVNFDSQILGVATHDIEDNSFGYVTTQGMVRNLNTNAYNEGETLFVSHITAGTFTNTAPPAPYEKIPVGITVRKGPGTSGLIYVAVQQATDFSDLSSVLVTGSYHYGDLWVYKPSGSTGVWTHTDQLSGSYGITGSINVTGSVKLNSITKISAGTSLLTNSSTTNTFINEPRNSYRSLHVKYHVMGEQGARAGSIMAITSGSQVQYIDSATNDIGNTDGIIFNVVLTNGNQNITVVGENQQETDFTFTAEYTLM